MTHFRLVGQVFDLALPVLGLEPFLVKDRGPAGAPVSCFFPGERLTATGWVADGERQITVSAQPWGIQMDVQGCGAYFLSADGLRLGGQDGSASPFDREVLLGPLIVLAMALRRTWCLHASAAIFDGKATAFLGDSGEGKSTLAAFLAASPGWTRLADDILPLTVGREGLTAWAHFPQLKLAADAQPGAALPEALPLQRVCLLAPEPPGAQPALQPLTASEALQTFLRHTAGTRLFPAALLQRHLDDGAAAAKGAAFFSLAYPHRLDALPLVRALLEGQC